MLRDVLPSFLPAFAALLGSWEPAFAETAAPGAFDDVAIADPAEALTFARTVQDGATRVLAVRGTAFFGGSDRFGNDGIGISLAWTPPGLRR